MFIDPVPDPNVSTFRPLLQHVKSNERVSSGRDKTSDFNILTMHINNFDKIIY